MGIGCLGNITDIMPDPKHPPVHIDTGVDDTKICFEGQTFWVLTPYKHKKDVRFQTPPGLNKLTGNAEVYGGLEILDIVISSYYAWGNSSFHNPAPKPNPSEVLNQEACAQRVRYPGFFNYPICDGVNGLLAAAQSYRDKSYDTLC